MRNFTKRSAAIAGATVLAFGGGTAAFAYASGWFQGGGAAIATSSSIKSVTAVITIPESSRLYPGAAVPVVGDVTNPNEYKVKVTGVSVGDVSSTKDGKANTACAGKAADLSVKFAASFDLTPGQVAKGAKIGSLTMGENANVACAGSKIIANLVFAGELTS